MTTSPASRGAFAALALAMLLSSLGTSIANVALPAFAAAFHATFPAVQWIVLGYLLAITTLVVGAGRLGDLFGRRRLLLGGLLLFAAASLLAGAAPGLPWLIAARGLQGLGAALLMALSLALAGELAPEGRKGSLMGLLGATSAAGTALGPSLGGLLVAGWGWRAIFFVLAPLGLLAAGLAARCLPPDRPAAGAAADGEPTGRPRFDTAGTLLLALALAAYSLALTLGRGDFGRGSLLLLAAAAAFFLLFLKVEARAAGPLVPPTVWRDRPLAASLAANLLVAAVMMGTLVVGPFYLSRGLGLSAAAVGLAMSAGPVMSALAGWPAGRVVDRWGSRGATLAGLAGLAAGSAALALLAGRFGLAGYLLPLAAMTASYALFQAANNTAVLARAAAAERGRVSGLLSLSRSLGLVTGTALLGALFARVAGDPVSAAPPALAHGLASTFLVAGLLALLALALAASSAEPEPNRPAALAPAPR